MKKKYIVLIGAMVASLLCVLGISIAKTHHNKLSPKQADNQSPMVVLHQAANDRSAVVKKVAVTQDFIPIYRQHDWLKVGVRSDGTVGWLNLKQYHQAWQQYTTPHYNYIVVQRSQDKPNEVNIVAYQNGKKLNDKQAKALYEKLKKQQAKRDAYFAKQWQSIGSQMRDMMRWQRNMEHSMMMNSMPSEHFFNN